MTLAELFYDLHSSVQLELAAEYGVTKEAFIQWAEDHCILESIEVDGEVAGVLALNGDSLHVAVRPEIKGRWLRQLQRFIEKQGRDLVCLTASSDQDARKFIERAGCVFEYADRNVARYKIKIDKLWFKENHHERRR